MLCPEVWSFKAPESNVKAIKGSSSEACVQNINKLHYNHLVSIVLPDTLHLPKGFSELLTIDCDYYKIEHIPVSELVNKTFIENFVKKGNLFALSIQNKIDCDDCVSVTPDGTLVLSLKKETYQTLGLDGKVSHFHSNTKTRYTVHVNLLEECLKPNKKSYERTKEQLSHLTIVLLVNWQPPGESICPSSVAKYFHSLNYDVEVCMPDFKIRTDYSVKTPHYESADPSEFVEWLGVFSLETNSNDKYLSTYEIPQPVVEYGQVKFLQWRGFFTSKQIQRVFTYLQKYVPEKPWISLYVQGFSDTPVSWQGLEHHYYVNGDCSYTIVLNKSECTLFTLLPSQKRYK